jgi:hypothetical protein
MQIKGARVLHNTNYYTLSFGLFLYVHMEWTHILEWIRFECNIAQSKEHKHQS